MLISKRHNFIFIHVPKAAGQSVTNALMPHAATRWQCILSPLIPFRYQLKIFTKIKTFTNISFHPKTLILILNLYKNSILLEKYEKAIDDCSKSIQLDPNYALAYYNRGVAYQGLEEYEKAKADYRKALTINPDLELAKENLALLE